ncbi:MAG: phosphatase PAP2 family protein [Bacteroidota bacterium]
MTELLQLDQELFFVINNDWHNSILDAIMPHWRNKYSWIPLYVVLAIYVVYQFKQKGVYLILFLAVTVGIADTTSSQLIKKNVQRIRPCNDIQLQSEVKLLVHCGGGYSFTSSHATNHFAVASFLVFTLGLFPWRKWRWLLWLWAASIAFGQVYVGVHYPLDILCGGLIGALIGWLMARLYLSRSFFFPNQWQVHPASV